MDQFHERLATLALDRIGSSALPWPAVTPYRHTAWWIGLPKTWISSPRRPPRVSSAPLLPLQLAPTRAAGLLVDVVVEAEGFSRLQVLDTDRERSAQVELGIDWRAHPPTILSVGPVLHPDDAVILTTR